MKQKSRECYVVVLIVSYRASIFQIWIQLPFILLQRFFFQLFDNVADPEVFSHRHVYKVAQKDVTSLAKVFGSLEEAKDQLGIEEYSFSQSTLEQVRFMFWSYGYGFDSIQNHLILWSKPKSSDI